MTKEHFISKNTSYTISTDKKRMDLEMIHHYLSKESYWARNISFEVVKRSVENSLNFGIFHEETQIGYARVISDFATIAYLGDVFILQKYRGKGLSKWLIQTIMECPELQGLRRWILVTGDAHELYKKYGWTELITPEKWMEKHNPKVYTSP